MVTSAGTEEPVRAYKEPRSIPGASGSSKQITAIDGDIHGSAGMMTATDDHGAAEPAGGSRAGLLGLPPDRFQAELSRFLEAGGEPSYRARQIAEWVFERGTTSFDEMTSLPVELRFALRDAYSLTPLTLAYQAKSRDGTVKHLWELHDGGQVESVLIPTRDRLTLCLSSQAGCALGCRFCATGYLGLQRQLDPTWCSWGWASRWPTSIRS